jgi:hypothetical protein
LDSSTREAQEAAAGFRSDLDLDRLDDAGRVRRDDSRPEDQERHNSDCRGEDDHDGKESQMEPVRPNLAESRAHLGDAHQTVDRRLAREYAAQVIQRWPRLTSARGG